MASISFHFISRDQMPTECDVGELLCLTIALRGGARLLLDVICLEENGSADR